MPRTELTLFAGTGEEVYLYSTIGATFVGGASELFIPILIAALIVMNTMLGSVYERVREIGVFNAVGLAPSHVGASVLVIAVVVLSTLYPARMASRIAVPALDMGWHLPPPEGDRLTLSLPFTVTGVYAMGLNTYLKEYLNAHVEVAVGQFACENVAWSPASVNGSPGYSLRFTAWLVPYDLGVSQRVELKTTPSDDPPIYELELVLDRLSGDASSWLRLNRTFMNILRKQLLIWRPLGRDSQMEYARQGQKELGADVSQLTE